MLEYLDAIEHNRGQVLTAMPSIAAMNISEIV